MSTCSDELQSPSRFGLTAEHGWGKQVRGHEIRIRKLDAQPDDMWDIDMDHMTELHKNVAEPTRFEMKEVVTMSQSTAATEHEDHAVDDYANAEDAGDDDGVEEGEEMQADEETAEEDETSDDEPIDTNVQRDMHNLQQAFPGFRKKYRLIKRIGEGTFSTVYKAEDVEYDRYNNSWDLEQDSMKWTPPPIKRHINHLSPNKRRQRFVAVKKIYVTSSPARILNELELLHDLRSSPSVCPLITAFRNTDQVVAILPYFRHGDFRAYFRDMTPLDISIYLRSLFAALNSVHEHKILHRDIKPTNFLYDPATQHGVLVDFGLAEREGLDSKPCLCHESDSNRKMRVRNSTYAKATQSTDGAPSKGYPKNDTRPSRRANRAGTRGFRAPEVLLKCTEQSTSIDVWSAGVILLTILSRRFPFFNSVDDVEATIEIATIFGWRRMKAAALLHGCVFETDIPTIGREGFSMEKIIVWSTCRVSDDPLSREETMAIRFLERCMELDPSRRITAAEALEHEFLRLGIDDQAEDDIGLV